MTSTAASPAPEWPAPGPGTWELDTAHFAPTVSRPVRDMVEAAMERGLGDGMELAGAPLKTMRARFVNGFFYTRLVPLVGGDRDLPMPPNSVMWLVTRVHPAFRRRAKRSAAALDDRYWNGEYARWEAEWKPTLVATNRRLGAVDVGTLDDVGLAEHLDRVWRHVVASGILHFRLHSSDLAPIGLLLVRSSKVGIDPAEAMSALAGASPATSAPAAALAAIAAEVDAVGAQPATLGEVRSASATAATMLDDYLAEYGDRLTGYDIRDQTLAEMPATVLASIRRGPSNATVASDAEGRGDEALDALLDAVPAGRRTEFARLVRDARMLYGLRDENGPLTVAWPGGILRRAVLEAGNRLVGHGRIDDTEHVFDATVDEMISLLRASDDAPVGFELARRCDVRMAQASFRPPAVLGRPPEQPGIDVLPGRMPEMMGAVLMVTTLLENERGATGTPLGLEGVGVGTVAVRGTARVVADADEALASVEPGDIVVTRFTAPTFNAVLAMAGGIVTEGGGLLSHTAVIARELGIPAVVGVARALDEIPDGVPIEVDPVAGTVRVLAEPSR